MKLGPLLILLTFFGYTAISFAVLGPLDSISESYYRWRDRNQSWAFNVFGALVFAGCLWMTQYPLKDVTKLMFVLSGASVWFLTVASLYKTQSAAHVFPTLLAILFGFGAVLSEFGLGFKFYTAFGGFVGLAVILKVAKVRYFTTIAELLAMVAVLWWFLGVNHYIHIVN